MRSPPLKIVKDIKEKQDPIVTFGERVFEEEKDLILQVGKGFYGRAVNVY